ncbi:cyclase type 10 [Seminavis robusta]|uniref:Cyclase type 10 n=1 Tax=Seminavis robusta TaxID=568900 RepID=A0A9N8H6E3_9STRA|nr:cyclase type 10 [Seminavis robusta]|eukprot:Sro42_g025550.1 cyclase type 10 (1388) ;mRNA; f:51887-56050
MVEALPLAPYVPRSVLTRLAESLLRFEQDDGDNVDADALAWPLEPQYVNLGKGAVFLLDISGYTKFARSAKGGADEVARVVNGLFRPMIDIVHSFRHCEIVKFCGDALLCVCINADVALALETAVACSLEVQREVFGVGAEERTGETDTSIPQLSLHVGVAASTSLSPDDKDSDFVELFVGGVSNRFEHLISGSPLEVLGEAVDSAQSNQVVVHPSAKLILQGLQHDGKLVGELQPNGFCAHQATRTEELRCASTSCGQLDFVFQQNASTLTMLNKGLEVFTPLDFIPTGAEFRQCSILFASLPDFVSGGDGTWQQAFHETQTIVETLQAALSEFGGNMRQLLRDDKGTVAIAVFGLPTRSREDDAARAVKAALAIASKTPCRAVGVATGDVLVGLVGSEQRCEYSAVGSPVNLSARLMCACSKVGKTVLVCSNTYESALRTSSSSLEFEEKQTITLKGTGEQDAYVPSTASSGNSKASGSAFLKKSYYKRSGSSRLSSTGSHDDDAVEQQEGMLIRDKELKAIEREMPGGSVCLVADAGSGKSTLASTFAEHALESGVATRVLYSATDSTETETPFFAFKLIVDDACRKEGGSERLFRMCGLDPRFAPLINPLLEAPVASNPQCDQLNSKAQREKAVESVASIVKRLARGNAEEPGPALLVIEDLHWMDDLSLLVLQALAGDRGSSVLSTTRHLPPSLQRSVSLTLELRALSKDDAISIASTINADLSQADVATLFERSGGNALFFTELLKAATSGGSFADIKNIPSTVRGVLVSRIDALPPSCIEFLKAASVFGRAFSPEATVKLLQTSCNKDGVNNLVEMALSSGLVERIAANQRRDERTLRFSHGLGGEAAYSLIPAGEVAGLHDQAAALVHSPELVEYHLVKAVIASPNSLRAKLAVKAMADGTRDRMALGAMELNRARARWAEARSLLQHIEDPEVRRELELNIALDEGRVFVAWVGFAAEEAGRLFETALSLTKRGQGSEAEIMALTGLWMNAMSNIRTEEGAKRSLAYTEELKQLAIDPETIENPESMDWTQKEICHVIWTEYGRRGRLRDMKRFLDPVLESLTPHRRKSVLGHNAETCATIFGAKVAWLRGEFADSISIAMSGRTLTDEPVSIAHSRVWGVAQMFAWNGRLREFEAAINDDALSALPPFHGCIKNLLLLYWDVIKGKVPYSAIHGRFMKYGDVLPWGEFPFTVCYALIQRGYELKLDQPGAPRNSEFCDALRKMLEYWRKIRDNSDGWGPGLFRWISGMLLLFEDPASASSNSKARHCFDRAFFEATAEEANGVLLIVETSRVKMILQRTIHFPRTLEKAWYRLMGIRQRCTGDAAEVFPLAFTDTVIEKVRRRRLQSRLLVGAIAVSAGIGAVLLRRRGTRSHRATS